MYRFVTTLAVALPLAFSQVAAEEQPGGARDQLDRLSAGMKTLHARFEQQVIGSDGAVQDQSGGKVWLRQPGMFRWEYGGDYPELVVADGERVWIHDEVLEQVTVRDQSEASANSPLILLTDAGELDTQFEVRELGESGGRQLLELRSLRAESEFERILLGFRADLLELMILEDAFGLRTEILFFEMELNSELDSELFRFQPPEGVDIIGDLRDESATR